VALSVKSGYAYFAIRKSDLWIVCGEEPEFEETIPVEYSFIGLLNLFATRDSKVSRWV
jgi:hypothetical protein